MVHCKEREELTAWSAVVTVIVMVSEPMSFCT
jgi:hypothetical protein